MGVNSLPSESKKNNTVHYTPARNFADCQPIFGILSLLDSKEVRNEVVFKYPTTP